MRNISSTLPLLILLPALLGAAPDGEIYCIDEGKEEIVTGLIADPGFMVELDGGLRFTRIRMENDVVEYALTESATGPDGPAVARVLLRPRELASDGATVSPSFSVTGEFDAGNAEQRSAIETAVASIVERDTGGFYSQCQTQPDNLAQEGDAGGINRLASPWVVLPALLAAGAIGLLAARRRRGGAGA